METHVHGLQSILGIKHFIYFMLALAHLRTETMIATKVSPACRTRALTVHPANSYSHLSIKVAPPIILSPFNLRCGFLLCAEAKVKPNV